MIQTALERAPATSTSSGQESSTSKLRSPVWTVRPVEMSPAMFVRAKLHGHVLEQVGELGLLDDLAKVGTGVAQADVVRNLGHELDHEGACPRGHRS